MNKKDIPVLYKNQNKYNLDDPRFRIRPFQQLCSAVSGALITSLFMTPLDVVKTRIQTQHRTMLSSKCYLYCNGLMDHICDIKTCGNIPQQKSMQLNGTIDGLLKISRNEGFRTLWSGLGPTLISALPATVVYFVAYEQLKIRLKNYHIKYISKDFNNKNPKLPIYVPLGSGVLARIMAVTVVSPIELIRTKMQSQKLSYFELRKAVRILIDQEGIKGLYKGLRPTIYRDVPFSGIYWTCYETVKSTFNVTNPTFGFSFFAGATSGSIAAFCTTPLDVIKTHQQIEFGEKFIYTEKPSPNIPKKTLKAALKELYRANGIRGLFAGLGPRLAKVTPACAIMISSFEYGKTFFFNHNIKIFAEENNIVLSYEKDW